MNRSAVMEHEAACARMTRGSNRRTYLSVREQRYATALARRLPLAPAAVADFLRRLRPRARPAARRLLEAALARNVEPAEVLREVERKGQQINPITLSPVDAEYLTMRALSAGLLYDMPEQLRRQAREGR